MNKIKKGITVRFFSIEANDSFFNDFISIHNANHLNEKDIRIINIREKKHLIKIHEGFKHQNIGVFFLTVVRERNTWQTRALGNGVISDIPINQGIIGDPYYFLINPTDRVILGFTTGPCGSLRGVATATLQQFNKNRLSKISLERIARKREFSKLRELSGFNKLYFKVKTSSLGEINDETPGILRELCATPFMANNSQVALTISEIGENGFSEENLVEIVDYLSENDGCSALTVHGIDMNGEKIHLDFSNAYATYKTQIEVRSKFVDEKNAKEILFNALDSFDMSRIVDS